MSLITYREALSAALWEEMERDKEVFLVGEDIGLGGGAFYVTKGFQQHFGRERVVDAPLSEAGFTGAAIGAALAGMRPVVEYQFADFVTETLKMILDFAAGNHYRRMGPVPIVFRLPAAALVSGGPYHSQNPEIWFFGTPGLKIVAPATAYDAKGMLKQAIRDDNPVIFLEYKKFYSYRPEDLPAPLRIDVPEGDYTVPFGKARLLREGGDITLLTFGTTVIEALEAAQVLEGEGVSVEVIDLRTLCPYDKESILGSVKKTGRLLILHEARKRGGVGGEFAAVVAEEVFEHLDAPIRRVGAAECPVPLSPPLEKAYLPSTAQVVEALRELAAF
ncbi:MAG: alpha-ketoacid dehydrogenase subunit beta [Candidatus Tectomicrobia bacterium]|uniref:Alpha-ketoacid dehydrogenase subunit beta n=1 Tax=Tectimicrobiota bacterium TaxID=2528274 RepID=A0A932ZSP5_UNCTE|nr:alpha-ketoacid dehydrogenase subunit beta [Candidatus Tectomicrobia bacterium]